MSPAPGLPASADSSTGRPVPLSELRPVLEWIQERTGLVFPRARRTHALRALRKLVRQHGIEPTELATQARHDPALLDALYNALTVSESYFFRIPEHFEAIRARVVAELEPGARLRCWSAGCSEGQEIYSLAMLLDEQGLLDRSELWATDLSPQVLEVGRRGRYRPWALRGRACQPLRALLTDESAEFEVAEHLRRAVHFAQDNLVSDAPAPGPGACGHFDLILCRHVLIYLDKESVARVTRRLYAALRPGGWLLCAPADPLLFEHAPFEVLPSPGGLLYRKPEVEPTTYAHLTAKNEVREPQLPPTAGLPAEFVSSRSALASMPGRPATPTPPRLPTSSLTSTSRSEVASPAFAASPSVLDDARAAFESRDWTRAVRLLEAPGLEPTEEVALFHLRALANLDIASALSAAQRYETLLTHHPHFHYLRARLALASRDDNAALSAVRRALYLQPDFLMAHHLQSGIWMHLANPERARISLTTLQQRCSARPDEQLVELGEGRTVAALRAEIEAALRSLSSSGGDHVG
ncbi:CheR family methyltransferase [Lujinxingia vulgaris]|uniref:CheR family methyltransferase n=1 Tax=Lujinxingia vulgaris TaxID=2600176 RepID=UPI001E3CD084|nr:protein-glutamate O-methyltransferase CheR [Lujinxingia vulgaris]